MNETPGTKICPHCAETIKAAAKVCPNCRFWQRRWSLYNPKLLAVLGLLLMVGYSVGMGIILDSMLGRGQDFARYRDQIQVAASSMSFTNTEKEPYITTVGLLTNSSEFGWKELEIEVQYLDKSNKLIDTGRERNFEGTILPHDELAFRIRILADKPESAYASHKVFVRAAKDAADRF